MRRSKSAQTVFKRYYHRSPIIKQYATARVHVIPILQDNYSYIVYDPITRRGALVDPADPEPVLEVMESNNITLDSILCTHHHNDHAGGNKQILSSYPDIKVYGADSRSTVLFVFFFLFSCILRV